MKKRKFKHCFVRKDSGTEHETREQNQIETSQPPENTWKHSKPETQRVEVTKTNRGASCDLEEKKRVKTDVGNAVYGGALVERKNFSGNGGDTSEQIDAFYF